jgi:hypothetical protein
MGRNIRGGQRWVSTLKRNQPFRKRGVGHTLGHHQAITARPKTLPAPFRNSCGHFRRPYGALGVFVGLSQDCASLVLGYYPSAPPGRMPLGRLHGLGWGECLWAVFIALGGANASGPSSWPWVGRMPLGRLHGLGWGECLWAVFMALGGANASGPSSWPWVGRMRMETRRRSCHDTSCLWLGVLPVRWEAWSGLGAIYIGL